MALLALSSAVPDFETLRFLYLGGGIDPFDASAAITSVSGPTTVASINCPLSQETFECPYGSGIAYTIISKTSYEWTASSKGAYTFTMDCNDPDENASLVTCGGFNWDGEFPTSTFEGTVPLNRTRFTYVEATITKGAELLTQTEEAAASSTASGEGTQASESGTSNASSATTPPSGTAQGSETDVEAPQSTGAAYRYGVEAPLLAVVGGIAAFVV